jgi:molybdate transport system ATP-binding protein
MTEFNSDKKLFRLQLSLSREDFMLNIDQHLPAQGITVLFGPSGSGKTTVLRCVAGLEKASGFIALGDETWQDSANNIFRPTWQRELGYVFQEASLFEHFDVRGNLHFGLRRSQRNGETDHALDLESAIELLGISHLLARSVDSLSGGERQRVAIARALATRPKLLLLDEPLASLDMARRKEVLPWLERLHRELRIPILYVTHSMDELVRLADHVVLLDKGAVQSSGPLSLAMASQEVALTIGDEAGIVTVGEVVEINAHDQTVGVRFGNCNVFVPEQSVVAGQKVRLRILARDVSLSLTAHDDITIQNCLRGEIESIEGDVHPSQALVRVRCGQEVLMSRVSRQSITNLGLDVGSKVWCQIKSVLLVV